MYYVCQIYVWILISLDLGEIAISLFVLIQWSPPQKEENKLSKQIQTSSAIRMIKVV